MRDAYDLLNIMQKRFPTTAGKFHTLTYRADGTLWLELVLEGPAKKKTTSACFPMGTDDMRRSPEYIADTICERVLALQTAP